MANKANRKPASPAPKPVQKTVAEPRTPKYYLDKVDALFPAWLSNFKIQAMIVAALAFIFYINTAQNEAAHDDTMVIVQNEYSLEGLAGIPDILTKDAYDSYYKQFNSGNQLSGGRYRPLSIVTFAIEQQFFGAVPKNKIDSFLNHGMAFGVKDPYQVKLEHNMHIRHVLNVLWYMLCVVLLLYFLRYIVFREHPVMALLAAIIFTIHPIHTEVVANVKSRDEIMSLIFMCLTFIYAFRYQEEGKKSMLWTAMICYFLAFLSKEYAITMLILLPLAFYLFESMSLGKSIMATLPYLGVVIVYVIMRFQIVAPPNENSVSEILNNPYAFASGTEKLGTEIASSLTYLKLLIFPHPLSADYSYNTIPYKDFSNPLVWLSVAVHIGMIWATIYFFKRRHVLCFALTFYLLHLFMVNNIVFDIGATLGERLIYHSSVGFAIGLAWLLYKGVEQVKPVSMGRMGLAGLMLVIIVLSGFKTIERNKAWKNDYTLFTTDIKTVPNSVLVNANVAAALIDKCDFEKDEKAKNADLYEGIRLLDKATQLHPTYVTAYLNKALAYFKLKQPDNEVKNLDKARELYPNHPKLPEMYYNVGVMFYLNKQFAPAASAWMSTLKLKPDHAQAQNALAVLHNQGVIK